MSVRVYVPATLPALARYVADGGVGPTPILARAVTEALRAAWPEGDEEEWEYAALMAAADDSVALLGEDDPPRRVVLAADVDTVLAEEDSSRVSVDAAFPFGAVSAVHVDTEDLDPAAYDPERASDLGWYAVQEIPDLLA